jgi:hypothetical protein
MQLSQVTKIQNEATQGYDSTVFVVERWRKIFTLAPQSLGNTKAGSQGPTPLLMPLVKSLYEEDPRV